MNPNIRTKILMAGDEIGHDIAEGIVRYIEFAIKDYSDYDSRVIANCTGVDAEQAKKVRQKMLDEYILSWDINIGPKYIRLVSNRSAHGFVVRATEGKFQRGDLLKCAGYAGPEKNKARGSVLADKYGGSNWTGIR